MFYQLFFSPQVKRYVIITYKDDIYELPYELPNNLRLQNFNNENCNTNKKTLEKQKLNFSSIALIHMKTRASLKYFVNDCSISKSLIWKTSYFDQNPRFLNEVLGA